MDGYLPVIILIVFAVCAWLVWSGLVYALFRDPSSGNGFDAKGRPRALSFRQVIGPFSRRKAERILALSRSQRTRAAWLRIVSGVLLAAVAVAVLLVLNRYGLAV